MMAGTQKSPESPFLYAAEAALYLRLSERTLEYYRIYGGGPVYRKHGNRILYHRADLDGWSQGRKYTSTGGAGAPDRDTASGRS